MRIHVLGLAALALVGLLLCDTGRVLSNDHSRCAAAARARPAGTPPGGIDLIALLATGGVDGQPVCCCSLRDVADERELGGAAQGRMAFKAFGDDFEAFLELTPGTYVYAGMARVADDDSIAIAGVNGRGSLALVTDATAGGWTWTARQDGMDVGSGTMR